MSSSTHSACAEHCKNVVLASSLFPDLPNSVVSQCLMPMVCQSLETEGHLHALVTMRSVCRRWRGFLEHHPHWILAAWLHEHARAARWVRATFYSGIPQVRS